MKSSTSSLLRKITDIRHMERGKLCQLPGRPYFNHQTWENGRNLVRYVPGDQVPSLRKAIEGYRRFQKLVEQYAAQIIQKSRSQRAENQKIQKTLKMK